MYVDQKVGLLMDGPTAVFAAGNVLTGKGNIKDSLDSGTEVGTRIAEAYLGLSDESVAAGRGRAQRGNSSGRGDSRSIGGTRKARAAKRSPRSYFGSKSVSARSDYDGDYRGWIAKVTPPDLQ